MEGGGGAQEQHSREGHSRFPSWSLGSPGDNSRPLPRGSASPAAWMTGLVGAGCNYHPAALETAPLQSYLKGSLLSQKSFVIRHAVLQQRTLKESEYHMGANEMYSKGILMLLVLSAVAWPLESDRLGSDPHLLPE